VENVNVPLRRSVAVAALVITPLMTSCGFNQPTDRVYTPSVGVNDRSGQVDVLHALVVSGADGSGTAQGRMSIEGDHGDGEINMQFDMGGQQMSMSMSWDAVRIGDC